MSFLNSQNKKSFRRVGFTIIELVIVVAILVLMCGVVIGAFLSFNRAEGVQKDAETILETLRLARGQTQAALNDTQYGVQFGSSSVTLFSGASYLPGTSGNQVYSLHSGDTLLSLNLVNATSSVVFERLTGAAASYGTVTVSSLTSSSSESVIIYNTGDIAGPSL